MKKLSKEQDKNMRENYHILETFLAENKVVDDNLRSYLQKKYIDMVYKWNDEGVSLPYFLKQGLYTAKKWWLLDDIRLRKREPLFSELDDNEQKVAEYLEHRFFINLKELPDVNEDLQAYVKVFYKFLTFRQLYFIYLRFYCGMDYKLIAQSMGTTQQNLHNMFQRIKDKFKDSVIIDLGVKGQEKLLNTKTGKLENNGDV